MKKLNLLLVVLLIVAFAAFALGSGEATTNDQGTGSATNQSQPADNGNAQTEPNATAATEVPKSNDQIGDYTLVIDSCRLAKDLTGEPVVIVKYIFSNVSNDNAVSFAVALEDAAYQNGVGLNEAVLLEDSANYDMNDQLKDIKKGATIEVEVAYELNDTTTDIEVEVSELFSFDDTTITKTFTIA